MPAYYIRLLKEADKLFEDARELQKQADIERDKKNYCSDCRGVGSHWDCDPLGGGEYICQSCQGSGEK